MAGYAWTDILAVAAAARAQSLAGLPPTYICVGSLDLFVDEDIEYARRLIQAGVPTELHHYPETFHGFDTLADGEVSGRARSDHARALRAALTSG